jgi:hypothetical protein
VTVRRKSKLIFGVGINDADYVVATNVQIDGKHKRLRICPFYARWKKMLERCYSGSWHTLKPTYKDCYVCEEWKTFSNFKSWMEKQDWEGKQLDKDILFRNNKEYSPLTCVFVDSHVNSFLIERDSKRGEYMIGVHWHKRDKRFTSACGDGLGKTTYLGNFNTELEAHLAWLSYKLERAKELAAKQTDSRVAKALIDRYQNYHVFQEAEAA